MADARGFVTMKEKRPVKFENGDCGVPSRQVFALHQFLINKAEIHQVGLGYE